MSQILNKKAIDALELRAARFIKKLVNEDQMTDRNTLINYTITHLVWFSDISDLSYEMAEKISIREYTKFKLRSN